MPSSEENFFDIIDSLRDIIDSEKDESTELPAGSPETLDMWNDLYEISALLTAGVVDFKEVLETILDVALKFTKAARGFIILFDEQRQYDVQIGRTNKREAIEPEDFAVSHSVVNKALAKRGAVFIPNVHDDLTIKNASSVIDLELRGAMCVPLQYAPARGEQRRERRRIYSRGAGDIIGVIYVDSNQAIQPLKEEDLKFFQSLANHATAAILNARLYRQATSDPLSGLATRRQFEIRLQDLLRRAEAGALPLSLLMIDIDHFKRVNDRWGHPVGDEVIRRVSDVIRNTLRGDDVPGRYGGEEFAVVIADADLNGAAIIAEKLRRAVQDLVFEDDRLKVAISVGVATYPQHGGDGPALVKRADQALYKAKNDGRNRVQIYSPQIADEAARTDKLAGIITGDAARDYRNVMMVLETIQLISSDMELDELLVRTLDKIVDATGAERGAIMLLRQEGDPATLYTAVARDRFGNDPATDEKYSKSIPRQVLESGKPVSVVDILDNEDVDCRSSILELNLRTVMCVPLVVRGAIIGVIYVDSRAVTGELVESNLLFFDALARQVALAIENQRVSSLLEVERGKKGQA